MALFMKQDFSPPVLSRKWLAIKFRPNMLIYSRENVIGVLESGLLFREDSVEVEQEAPDAQTAWLRAGGSRSGWFTAGERNVALLVTGAVVLAAPPRNLHRWTLLKLATYALIPIVTRATHRSRSRGLLHVLLSLMRDYMSLARRATACCREYATLHARLESVTTAVESTHTMLCRQQTELLHLMSRASSALLGNVPWLRGDVTYDCNTDNLMKIHHAFLVVQSTLLKYIAMAHYMPTAHTHKMYKNHNERIYWIHNVLIHHLIQEFQENYDALERMYRLLKNYGTKDCDSALKKPGTAINDTWLYSDVHTGIARSSLELKLALDKCSNLDMFLDSCALNKQELDLDVLDRDIDKIIENITKCLSTAQNSQIRLKKLLNKVKIEERETEKEVEIEEESIVKIEDKDPEIRDEVFYLVNTAEDIVTSPVGDIVTGPGKREKENSKVVLKELKRKLVKREDLMRERERQALAKTMPDLKTIPEFPRQIPEEFADRKGLISKLERKKRPIKVFVQYKIGRQFKWKRKCDDFEAKIETYERNSDLPNYLFEANARIYVENVLLSVTKYKGRFVINIWRKGAKQIRNGDLDSSGLSEGLSVIEGSAKNKITNEAVIRNKKINNSNDYKFSKKDLELSPSSSETDFEVLHNERIALLNDVRRHRVARKKNVPSKKPTTDNVDESLKPIEYSFGTGMAMASVLQVNNRIKMPNMQEEVFIGDGEVSSDSGNDEDAQN